MFSVVVDKDGGYWRHGSSAVGMSKNRNEYATAATNRSSAPIPHSSHYATSPVRYSAPARNHSPPKRTNTEQIPFSLPDRFYTMDLPYAPGDIREHDFEARHNHPSRPDYRLPPPQRCKSPPRRRQDKPTPPPRPSKPPTPRRMPTSPQVETWTQPDLPPYPNVRGVSPLDTLANPFQPKDNSPPVSDDNEDVNVKILKTGLARECRAAVAMLRPDERFRFNGDLEKFDFETVLKKHERAMSHPGMTPEIKVGELPFWFSGVALQHIELFIQEEDPETQYNKSIARLKLFYGSKCNSVENMLTKLLAGPEVKKDDQKAITMLLIELEKFDLYATKTNRRKLLDNAETMNRIIRKRLPNSVGRWANKTNKKARKWDGVNETDKDMTFGDLIKFVSEQVTYTETLRIVSGKEKEKSKPPVAPPSKSLNNLNSAPQRKGPWKSNPQGGGEGGSSSKPSTKPPTKWQQKGAETNKNNNNNNNILSQGSFGYNPTTKSKGQPSQSSGSGGKYQSKQPPPAKESSGNQNTSLTLPKNASTFSCQYCQGTSFHSLDVCTSFLRADIQRRYDMIKKGAYCYKCLSKGHKAQDCELDVVVCDKCKTNKHHTLLHKESTQ